MQVWEVLKDMEQNGAVYEFTAHNKPRHLKVHYYRVTNGEIERYDTANAIWTTEKVYFPFNQGLGKFEVFREGTPPVIDFARGWHPDMSLNDTKNLAYWERNMLALLAAQALNVAREEDSNGWYEHEGDGFEGWSRVISLEDGKITFHVPDSFDLGDLPRIEPNWDGHSTFEKWENVRQLCGIAQTSKA